MSRFQALSYVRKNEGEYLIRGKYLFENKEHLCQIIIEKGMIKGVMPFSVGKLTEDTIEYITKATMHLHTLEQIDVGMWKTISYEYLKEELGNSCRFHYRMDHQELDIYFKQTKTHTNDVETLLYFDFPVGNKRGRIYLNEENLQQIKDMEQRLVQKERIRLMMISQDKKEEPM